MRAAYESTLRESEARFRALTKISADFHWETDTRHRISMLEYGDQYRATQARGKVIERAANGRALRH